MPKSCEGGYAYRGELVAFVRQKCEMSKESKGGRKEVVDEIGHEYSAD